MAGAFFISMKTKLIFLSLLAALAAGAQVKYSPAVEAKIKQVESGLKGRYFTVQGEPNWTIEERMAFYRVKGLSLAVIKDYKVEWARGYGWADSAEGRRVTPETVFEPGSISKSLNAFGILKLVQDKKIDLNADINQYLKDWKFPYDSISHGKKITLKNLLSHTAGLTVHGFPGYYYRDTFPTLYQILDGKKPANTSPVRSGFEPGLKYQYSGGGTMISQLMLMQVSGQAYDKYMAQTVFRPLGMKNTFFTQPPPAQRKKQLATGYGADGKEIPGKYPILLEQAAGGLWTTPTDLCNFIIELQKVLKGTPGKVLNAETVNLMLKGVERDGMDSVGLGVFLPVFKDTRYFSHGAGNQGFRGQYWANFYEGSGVVIFINSEGGGIMPEVVESVAEAYGWKDFYFPKEKKAMPVADAGIEKFAGVYKADETVVSVVKRKWGYSYFSSNMDTRMYFTSANCFFNKEWSTEKCFEKDSTGEYAIIRTMPTGQVLKPLRKIKILTLPGTLMDQYKGTYFQDESFEVIEKEKELFFKFSDNNEWHLHFFSETGCYADEVQGQIFTFLKDAQGKVTGINIRNGAAEHTAKKIK